MLRIQLTLTKDAYRDAVALANSLARLREVGAFTTLESRYAAKLGVVSGELPAERIGAVEALDIVSTLNRDDVLSGFGAG